MLGVSRSEELVGVIQSVWERFQRKASLMTMPQLTTEAPTVRLCKLRDGELLSKEGAGASGLSQRAMAELTSAP